MNAKAIVYIQDGNGPADNKEYTMPTDKVDCDQPYESSEIHMRKSKSFPQPTPPIYDASGNPKNLTIDVEVTANMKDSYASISCVIR